MSLFTTPERIFITPLTPRACRARLDGQLAMPFLTWLSESQVDGRVDLAGFVIWKVFAGRHAARLRGTFEPMPHGTKIVTRCQIPSSPYQAGAVVLGLTVMVAVAALQTAISRGDPTYVLGGLAIACVPLVIAVPFFLGALATARREAAAQEAFLLDFVTQALEATELRDDSRTLSWRL